MPGLGEPETLSQLQEPLDTERGEGRGPAPGWPHGAVGEPWQPHPTQGPLSFLTVFVRLQG